MRTFTFRHSERRLVLFLTKENRPSNRPSPFVFRFLFNERTTRHRYMDSCFHRHRGRPWEKFSCDCPRATCAVVHSTLYQQANVWMGFPVAEWMGTHSRTFSLSNVVEQILPRENWYAQRSKHFNKKNCSWLVSPLIFGFHCSNRSFRLVLVKNLWC